MKAPTTPGYHFVSPDYSPSPPYQLCRFINTLGECPMWSIKRVAPDVTE